MLNALQSGMVIWSVILLVNLIMWIQAPEIMTSEEGVTLAVDVYSFGVMLHEMITGESPGKRRERLAQPKWVPSPARFECCSHNCTRNV
jgi:serine/threonine protein kinase